MITIHLTKKSAISISPSLDILTSSTSSNSSSKLQSTADSSGFLYYINIQVNQYNHLQDFADSISRSRPNKDNINRSKAESQSQMPPYNNIVNIYQKQTRKTAREISENFRISKGIYQLNPIHIWAILRDIK